MTNATSPLTQDVLDQLNLLGSMIPPAAEDTVRTARQWIDAIETTSSFLEDRAHPIAFIGSVGVGKSSLIGVAANLLVGPTPRDRTSLKNNSVLAIGSGRTTVCEVRIRAVQDEDRRQVGLVVEPFSDKEMEKEITIFAEDEWRRHRPEGQKGGEDDTDPTSQEIQRFIRGMTGYTEYQESYSEGKTKKRRKIDPLDEVVPLYDTASALAEHLLAKANLPSRTITEWWWETEDTSNLMALKRRFEAVNQGLEATAMLPRKMSVVVPNPLPDESGERMDLTLIDTRGMEVGGSVESRADLQELLRDSRSVIVFCATFKDAPGETLRSLLKSMTADAELRETIPRTLLVLLDQGDSDQVNGADGDREFGQEIKIDECHIALEGFAGSRMIEKTQIIAFDTLKDDRSRLLEAIKDRLSRLREKAQKQLEEQVESAQLFLGGANNEVRPALRAKVDDKLKDTMARYLTTDAPLHDPLAGLYGAIRETRYASVVYATCRRNGAYPRLNLYAAVRAEASRAATEWLDAMITAIINSLSELEQNHAFNAILDDIRLRKKLYQEAQLKVIRNYTEQVGAQVESKLKPDLNIWEICCNEWGRGDGFKSKVLSHLESWSRRQQDVTAHENTGAARDIPLLGEVVRPAQAPRFTLQVRNLRALRKVSWSPEPLSVLIGANGAGKTTLLQTLKLLRLAYERSLSGAVSTVLGGSGNLRSWRMTEEDSVEIGIDIGEVSWRIQLTPKEGSVDNITHERLSEQGREIFSRDSLGTFMYGGERIEPSPQLGLRALMDRGVHEPALRAMAKFFQRITVNHDPDLWSLRKYGSNTSEDRILDSRGANALALLRRWRQDRANSHRYQFVTDGLAAAFPNIFENMDFVEAGTTLVARIYRPGEELPSFLADEANGVLQLLILLCAIASVEDESVVAIDEPENSLHPYALRAFLRRTARWARQHNLTVLLATHSTVLLDELTGQPEQVYVMKASTQGESVPTRLDHLCDHGWLADFKLGDLYEQGEIGSNEDEA